MIPPRIHPRKMIEDYLLLCAVIAFLIFMFSAMDVGCDELPLADRLDSAIVTVCLEGVPSHKIGARPRHPMVKDSESRHRLAQAIADASARFEVDPWLMLVIAFREGSFTGHRAGTIGERSTFQIVERAVDWLHKLGFDDCTLETVEGAAICCAAYLTNVRSCGTESGALLMYATGRTCTADTKHLKWLVKDRLTLADELEGM